MVVKLDDKNILKRNFHQYGIIDLNHIIDDNFTSELKIAGNQKVRIENVTKYSYQIYQAQTLEESKFLIKFFDMFTNETQYHTPIFFDESFEDVCDFAFVGEEDDFQVLFSSKDILWKELSFRHMVYDLTLNFCKENNIPFVMCKYQKNGTCGEIIYKDKSFKFWGKKSEVYKMILDKVYAGFPTI